jgi:hypothetical protein
VNDFALNARRWPQGDSYCLRRSPVTHPVLVSICQTAVGAQWIGTFSLALAKGAAIDISTQLDIHSADAARTLTCDKFDDVPARTRQTFDGAVWRRSQDSLGSFASGLLDSDGLPVPASDLADLLHCGKSALQYGPLQSRPGTSIFITLQSREFLPTDALSMLSCAALVTTLPPH